MKWPDAYGRLCFVYTKRSKSELVYTSDLVFLLLMIDNGYGISTGSVHLESVFSVIF